MNKMVHSTTSNQMGQLETRRDTEASSQTGKPRRREWWYLSIILVSSFMVHAPFMLSTAFFSDESVYAYSGYAILRGEVPYLQIMLPHPPLGYYGMGLLVFIAQGSLLLLRSSYLFLFMLIGVLTFVLLTRLRRNGALAFNPLVAVGILMIYPIPYALTTPLEFLLFEIPLLLSLIFLVDGLTMKRSWRLIISGMFLAVAMMIWYPALFVAITTVGFAFVYSKTKFNWPESLRLTSELVIGGSIMIGVMLGLIMLSGTFNNYVLQSITLQSSLRAPYLLTERLRHITIAVEEVLPLIVLGTVGAVDLIRRWLKTRETLYVLPLWMYLGNFLLIATIPRVTFSHYFAFLTPFLTYLASDPIESLVRWLFFPRAHLLLKQFKLPARYDIFKIGIAILMVLLVVLVPLYKPQGSGFLATDRYTKAEQTVGGYVASVSSPNDKIWTSEGGIAYFAGRLIVPPNSTQWPFQTSYSDIFNNTYVDNDNVTQPGLGVASPKGFMEGWIMDRTRVLVFIFNNGPIPYPDEQIWYGWNGTSGVGSWVTQNYHLNSTFTFENVDYNYTVWLIN